MSDSPAVTACLRDGQPRRAAGGRSRPRVDDDHGPGRPSSIGKRRWGLALMGQNGGMARRRRSSSLGESVAAGALLSLFVWAFLVAQWKWADQDRRLPGRPA
jgi:hypothetical protein